MRVRNPDHQTNCRADYPYQHNYAIRLLKSKAWQKGFPPQAQSHNNRARKKQKEAMQLSIVCCGILLCKKGECKTTAGQCSLRS